MSKSKDETFRSDMKLVLLGPPGAGKGTLAHQLIEKYHIPQISTGDILRQSIKEGTKLGKEAKSYMQRGDLVPDDVIINIVRERIKADDCNEGYIFDGFPRTVAQAEALDVVLQELATALDAVVNIDVPEEVVVKRLSGRRTCKQCGTLYHMINNPPTKMGVCNKCGGELFQRADDNETTIRQRLAVYKEQTFPLIEYYTAQNLVKTIPGGGTPEEVFEITCKTLG